MVKLAGLRGHDVRRLSELLMLSSGRNEAGPCHSPCRHGPKPIPHLTRGMSHPLLLGTQVVRTKRSSRARGPAVGGGLQGCTYSETCADCGQSDDWERAQRPIATAFCRFNRLRLGKSASVKRGRRRSGDGGDGTGGSGDAGGGDGGGSNACGTGGGGNCRGGDGGGGEERPQGGGRAVREWAAA